MDNINWLNREEMLIGKESINKLKNSNVIVFGLGGVGSYVVEGLVRVGIGNITIVDKDIVDITNINRQLIADTETVGMAKVDAEKARILKINPQINVASIKEFVNKDNIENIFAIANNIILNNATTIENSGTKFKIDYVIDAIDTVSSKLEIIKYCHDKDIKIISSMGTGNKLDASRFEITDINKTSVCPLAKTIRKDLRKLNINHLKVLYSKEEPIKVHGSTPASISFVPSVAGLLIAGEVVRELM